MFHSTLPEISDQLFCDWVYEGLLDELNACLTCPLGWSPIPWSTDEADATHLIHCICDHVGHHPVAGQVIEDQMICTFCRYCGDVPEFLVRQECPHCACAAALCSYV